ncbi:MAG: hypothetical protein HY097_10780 [Nitrospinae bacterium]|nr:hypothetical protein [Nitrospinota bacterium]MBI3815447.1 hypothetical protein [Nitrospinota bacterium]
MRFLKRVPFYPLVTLIFIAAATPFAFGIIPTVNFRSERIDVQVYPEEILVEGYYFYKNPFPFPVVQGFYIPFPIDRDHPEPFDLNVERLMPGKEMFRLRHIFGKTGFEVYFHANEEAEIRVSYRQKAVTMDATYILTTTKPWGKPLEKAVYILYPHGTIIASSNYPFNLPGDTPGFHKTGFMPDKDWQFTWRKNEKEM